MNQIYLDNAATTAMDPQVIEAMMNVMINTYGNPSSVHQMGAASRDIIEDARQSIARLLKAEPSEIFFTSGATEAINTILEGAVKSLGVNHIITSPLEHPAVIETIDKLKTQYGVQISMVNFDELGQIDLQHLKELTKIPQKNLVCLMHANNELGNLLSIKKASEICKQNGAFFFSDTVQSMGKFKLNFAVNNLDFAAGSAHKFHGPKGVGFMFIRGGLSILPHMNGGPQERNMRAGTENISGIAGLAKAFEIAYENLDDISEKILSLKQHLIQRIKTEIPEAIFHGDSEGLYSIINIGLPKATHNKMLIFNMDVEGFAVSGGSACSSGVMNISHVIKALGKSDDYIPVRVSFSKYNNLEEIDKFVDVLKKY